MVGPLLMDPVKMEIWGCRQDTPAKMEEAGINFCLTQDTSSGNQMAAHQCGHLHGQRAF